MFARVLLGVLCVHLARSAEVAVENDRSTAEFDHFVPYNAQPIKNEFDWRLLQKFTLNKGYKNVVLSPYSLNVVMALLYEGSGGTTEKEFRNIMRFPENKTQVRHDIKNMLKMFSETSKDYILNIGTNMYLDSKLSPESNYRGKAQEFYRCDVLATNFSHPVQVSGNINSWVNDFTKGRIKTLVTPEDIQNAILIVANVIYFQGSWSIPFPIQSSYVDNFYTNGNGPVRVPYMNLTQKFYHFDSQALNAEVLRIPYKGGKFAMVIILPHSRTGLQYLIDNLDLTDLTLSVRWLDSKCVQVILPKFSFDFQTSYAKILREFGFEALFSSVASFPGIVRGKEGQLIVTDILQKTGIDVNEEGTTAYAATQVTLINKFGEDSNCVVFNASRPFLFYIQEETNNNILFIGKVEDPSVSNVVPLPQRYGDDDASPSVPQSSPEVISIPNNDVGSQFELELLKNSIGTSKNVFLSPSSVKVSLAMLAAAASGTTAQEIYRKLQLPYSRKNEILYNLIRELSEHHPNSLLEFRNILFVSNKERLNPQYQRVVENDFRALLQQLNYQDRESAALAINTFVRNATRGLISSILSADEIDPQTKVILTNALYFKATWQTIFDKNLTALRCFHTTIGPQDCVTTPIMVLIDTFDYLETPNSQIVRINYAGDTRAMLIVVPKSNDGLPRALHDVQSYRSFSHILANMNKTDVEVRLPRFEIDYNVDLVRVLEKMGIRELFGTNPSLDKIFEGGSLGRVDSFLHKAKIEVNEEGTKASAVSLVSVIPLMGSSTPMVLADHPFAFFIFNAHTNTILFEGILNEPQTNSRPATKTGNVFNYADIIQNRLPILQTPDNQGDLYNLATPPRL